MATDLLVPMIRTSGRKSFKHCPQQWEWAWNQGLKRRGTEADALWFGTGVHVALAEWYIPGVKRGVDPRYTWEKWVNEEIRQIKTVDTVEGLPADNIVHRFVEAKELGLQMFSRYLNEYGQDEHMEMLSREQPFSVGIPHPKTKKKITDLKGTFDGAHRDLRDGFIYLDEHKSAATIRTRHLVIDDQAGTYWAVATHVLRKQGLIGEKEQLRGIIYNFLRKAADDERPMNADGLYCNKPVKQNYFDALEGVDGWTLGALKKLKVDELDSVAVANFIEVLGEPSKQQPPAYFLREFVPRTRVERRGQIERIGAEVMAMERFISGEQPLYKNPRYDCDVRCDYFDLCEVHEAGGDVEGFAEAMFTVVDRYADHRKSAAE